MKKLKLRGTLSDDYSNVLVAVVEQTHTGNEFGAGYHDFKYTHTDGRSVNLTSDTNPHFKATVQEEYVHYAADKQMRLYLNGVAECDRLTGAVVPVSYWPCIKHAVIAYNNTFKEGAND